ncbi:hypothetical protein P280DRAFT_506443 [Massarina eburnea CBS 473.64]|uniref:Uncharacterized protein n=1 Tax=Massarina eburnea CBS 473.64 TaxID=1395130 RepID=A0A6A6S5F3_9PLEO|nr:hypothetical protein P280DRAFT_506443 [Massarina eburnea CBS 473.64]
MAKKKNFNAMKRMEKTKGLLPPGKADEEMNAPKAPGTIGVETPRKERKKKTTTDALVEAPTTQSSAAYQPSTVPARLQSNTPRSLEAEIPNAGFDHSPGKSASCNTNGKSTRRRALDLSGFSSRMINDHMKGIGKAPAEKEDEDTPKKSLVPAAQLAPLWKPNSTGGDFSAALVSPDIPSPRVLNGSQQADKFIVPQSTMWTAPSNMVGSYAPMPKYRPLNEEAVYRSVSAMCAYMGSMNVIAVKRLFWYGAKSQKRAQGRGKGKGTETGPTIFERLARKTEPKPEPTSGSSQKILESLDYSPDALADIIRSKLSEEEYRNTCLGTTSILDFLIHLDSSPTGIVTKSSIAKAFILCAADFEPDPNNPYHHAVTAIDTALWMNSMVQARAKISRTSLTAFLSLLPFENEDWDEEVTTDTQVFEAWELAVKMEKDNEREEEQEQEQEQEVVEETKTGGSSSGVMGLASRLGLKSRVKSMFKMFKKGSS